MARPTGKQRRENQAAAAKVNKEKRDKAIKEKNERIAAKATGRTKAAQTKVSARLKIQNAGKTTDKPKSSTKRRALMTKPERAAADRAARLARSKARKAKK